MTFNPSRLTIVRKRRMLNKKQLAKELGLHPETPSLWEKGVTIPDDDNVEALVRLLKYPKAFFFGPDIDEPSKDTSFRSQTSMSAAERDAALAAGQLGFEISDWVTARFNLPAQSIPELHLFDPESAALTLRQEWGLGEKPISNMLHLLESKGVRIFSLAENTAHVNAYSLWRKDTPYVFLNTFKSAECSRFDAAHELAHLVLHKIDGAVTGRAAEDQANRFASAFLMPKDDVLSLPKRIQHLDDLIAVKKRWRVSLAAMTYRVHKLGIISEWQNRMFCIEIVKNKYNRNEPSGIEREQSVVWDKVLKALWAEQTTPRDIADALNLPFSELSSLVFGVLNQPVVKQPGTKQELAIVPQIDDYERR